MKPNSLALAIALGLGATACTQQLDDAADQARNKSGVETERRDVPPPAKAVKLVRVESGKRAPAIKEALTAVQLPAPTRARESHSEVDKADADASAVSLVERKLKTREKYADLASSEEVVGRTALPATAQLLNAPMAVVAGSPVPLQAQRALNSSDAQAHIRPASEPTDFERYGDIADNPVKRVTEDPVSTFSIDVDTGAYANVRRFLNDGRLPPRNAVRIEEMINYFSYDYAPPRDRAVPFALHTQLAPTPWNPRTHLLRVGVQGYELDAEELPHTNLVFLIDVSGSMRRPNKLGLLKNGLLMLAEQMRAEDRVSIVVYAGASGVVLEPTAGDNSERIEAALNGLRAGGSTNGAAGIKLAYQVAREAFIPDGINRVVLATDGDFNVGTTNFDTLKDMVEWERESGVSLTTLGFGTGNYNEHLMEQLANAGNGNHAYIDSDAEAHKVLVEQMAGTLATIAKDVKIQIEFNPKVVSEYRLIGYVNRKLAREDFDNDKVDAGEIGAGHTVTALYEVALAGDSGEKLRPLRYGAKPVMPSSGLASGVAHLRVRYKAPGGKVSQLIERPIHTAHINATPGGSLKFAAAVAGFGQLLRGGKYMGDFSYDSVVALADTAIGTDGAGRRAEFLNLVERARALSTRAQAGRVALVTRGQ
jgi:Ca-activated chloride channel homolog